MATELRPWPCPMTDDLPQPMLPIWLEARAALELVELLASPLLGGARVPDGGQHVLLVPGFLLGDDSLGLMTGWLRRTGHHAERSGLVLNADCSEASVSRLAETIERLAERAGRRVVIVGQSRGGLYARVLAVRRPDLICGIVTLGAPVMAPAAVHPMMVAQAAALASLRLFQLPGLLGWECVDGACCRGFWADLSAPFPHAVGYESIYSRTDGIVDWRACLDPAATHREVDSSHYGMSVNAAVYELIGAALASFPSRAPSAA